METTELHRGRLVDHIQLVVRDLAASRAFYTAVFEALQVPMGGEAEGFFWADEFCVSTAAADRAMVEAFHRAALAHGGTDNGAPGERPYHPGYYAAFVLDPDGNNIEAVYHGEAQRTAASVRITF
jgi:catechol 2,3-dioxygenase-like lactoylglutathione lyase family enzyme